MLNKLNLGAGNELLDGYINVDLRNYGKPNCVQHNLNVFPYPFQDNSFDEVLLYSILEHLDNPLAVLNEVHRICRPGAILKIRVPYYNSSTAHGDITHKHYFCFGSFDHVTYEKNEIARAHITDRHYIIYWRQGIPTRIGKLIPNLKIFGKKRLGIRDILASVLGEILSEIYIEMEALK